MAIELLRPEDFEYDPEATTNPSQLRGKVNGPQKGHKIGSRPGMTLEETIALANEQLLAAEE